MTSTTAPADRAELTFDETVRARQLFQRHVDNFITTEFELRTTLADLGQFPSDAEIRCCLDVYDNKMTFNQFLHLLAFLKCVYFKPEPTDIDTIRAFAALGGTLDRKGEVNTGRLRATIRDFDLTIDIDSMLKEVDEDDNGTIDYSEFQSLWETRTGSRSFIRKASEAETFVPAFLGGNFDFGSDGGKPPAKPAQLKGRGKSGVGFSIPEDSAPPPTVDEDEDTKVKLLRAYLLPTSSHRSNSLTKSGSFIKGPDTQQKRKSTKPGALGASGVFDRSKSVTKLPPLNGAQPPAAAGGEGTQSEAPNAEARDSDASEGDENATPKKNDSTAAKGATAPGAHGASTSAENRGMLVLPEPYILGSGRFRSRQQDSNTPRTQGKATFSSSSKGSTSPRKPAGSASASARPAPRAANH